MSLLVEDDEAVLPGGGTEDAGAGASDMSAGGLAPLSAAADLDLSIPAPARRATDGAAADDAASAAAPMSTARGYTVKSTGAVQSGGGSGSGGRNTSAARLASTTEHYRELMVMSTELNAELGKAVSAQNTVKTRELQGQLAKVELLLNACKEDLAELGVEGARLAELGVEAELGVVGLGP